jgi:CRP-like cAMP-binding protein
MRSSARHWPISSAADAVLRPQIDLLDPGLRAAFDTAGGAERVVPAEAVIIAEGEAPGSVEVICSGWAARYKSLGDGRRQIVSFLLPGDLIGIESEISGSASATIEAITTVRLQSGGRVGSSGEAQLDLAAVTALQKVQAEEMLLSIGQRGAVERMAALLLDLYDRAAARRLVHAGVLAMPLTQKHLSAALGLSLVHVNRVIGILRRAAIIRLRRGNLDVIDRDRLARSAQRPPRTKAGTNCFAAAGRAKRVLVVEDEFHTAQYVDGILRRMGIQVVGPVGALRQAIVLATTERVDAALLDVRLQHSDRVYDVADVLRRREIPFSFVTAYADHSFDRFPTDVVLRKPFREDQLEAVVRSLMRSDSSAARP